MKLRLVLGAIGVAAGLFGALSFLQTGWDNMMGAVLFLAGGVAIHDGLIAPITIALTVLGTRLLPRAARRRVTLGVVVLLTVTASALPAILRLGARSDNDTILPRNYLVGWLIVAALILLGTLVIDAVTRSRGRAATSASSAD